MSAASANKGVRRQRWIPLLALLPLLALMAADAVMVAFATRSDPGLVADAPRRIGLAQMAPAAALRSELSVAPQSGGHALTLRLRDQAGAAVSDATVEGRLERTTHAGADQPLHFAPAGEGTWTAEVMLPDAGSWQVSITARDRQGRSALAIARLAP